jgi:6-phosphogluconolactonase
VGTYTSGKSEGIYLYRLNLASGELKHFSTAKGISNPSFLAIDAERRHLYAVNEETEFQGKPGGAVSAFSINQQTGNLTFLNQQPSLGGAPCYVTVDGSGKFILLANYVGGNVSVLPLRRDGSLDAASQMVQHQGASVNRQRQESPHAHCILLDRANRYAFAVDLGTDKIMSYRFNAHKGKLTPNQEPSVSLKPGAGPRHFVFHPSGRQAYVINELDSTITVFTYNARRGSLTAVQTISTLPKDFSGANSCADLHISPSGKFLYGSNRGHDSIVLFAIEKGTGKLQYVSHEPTQGKTPRNFAIDPAGAYLLAANQNSDSIVTFRIDPLKGKLTPTGHIAEVPAPVCLKLIPSFS